MAGHKKNLPTNRLLDAFDVPPANEAPEDTAKRLRVRMLRASEVALRRAERNGTSAEILACLRSCELALEMNGLASPAAQREPVTVVVVEHDEDEVAADRPVTAAIEGAQGAGPAARH
jgi:hypothetical protein